MALLRNKRKLVAVSRETQEHTTNSQSQNRVVSGSTADYITQVSEETESSVTNNSSHKVNRTESSILGALSKLDKFLLNPQKWTLSWDFPGASPINALENCEPTGNRSQKDSHPDVEFATHRTSNSTDSDPEETSHTVTVVQENNPYRSAGTSSGKQKKAHSTSQPHFHSENTPGTKLKQTKLFGDSTVGEQQ